MPIRTQNELPAKAVLEDENIFVMDEHRAVTQDIRPLEIVILNLMPLKEETEVQLLRALSNSPLQTDITFLQTASYTAKNTSSSHLNKFYVTFEEIRHQRFDGMIITGAPVELMDFEEVEYWEELTRIMDWSKKNVTSTFHICWGAQAGLYYHHGVKKTILDQKVSGVFSHEVLDRKVPLMRGFDDVFLAPHSRNTESVPEDIRNNSDLIVLAVSKEVGDLIVMTKDGKQIFVLGHLEYDRVTLDAEYRRDLGKGMDPEIPKNYYENDNPEVKPRLTWRAASNCLYSNWLNYYVYQVTPYDLDGEEPEYII